MNVTKGSNREFGAQHLGSTSCHLVFWSGLLLGNFSKAAQIHMGGNNPGYNPSYIYGKWLGVPQETLDQKVLKISGLKLQLGDPECHFDKEMPCEEHVYLGKT